MVMPSMPIALSASLTSSSLNGWIIASIFFMVSRLEYIPFLAMHADVESLDFLLPANSQSHRHVTDLENDKSAHNCQRPAMPDPTNWLSTWLLFPSTRPRSI